MSSAGGGVASAWDRQARPAAAEEVPVSYQALPSTGRGAPVTDWLWHRLTAEAQALAATDAVMAGVAESSILQHASLGHAIAYLTGRSLGASEVSAETIDAAFRDALADDPRIGQAISRDVIAQFRRDPACERPLEIVLYAKGFHAIQCYRLAHWLWTGGRRDFALWLQRRASQVLQVDIHPAARFGAGIVVDHATGLVVGSTAAVGDETTLMHGVTLGATGKEHGDRHPKIGRGVLIGAGATVLGNVVVGDGAKIGAGSVVLRAVAAGVTVAGTPARVVARQGESLSCR